MRDVNIPELLAPVGGWQQLRAAVQNGADAIYMGGPLFNARIKAENFTKEDMERAIEYAHDRNVRVYVTINTLIKDSELRDAFSYVNFLYGVGADAVILQDVGLSRLVRTYLPDMDMHMSTQGTIYNGRGAIWAKQSGFSRIVPARELTLAEIKELTDVCHDEDAGGGRCQIEVFVHGAMCMCYSGQCHMSRAIGGGNGRSGNRGTCAQPCRLPYVDETGRRGYFLSPKDMCTLDILPEICEAGVDSLKIEGRLKSPQYVAVVTGLYRKYLDIYRECGRADVSREDMDRLLAIFNRGGSSSGYMEGNPGAGLLSGESPKNQGVYMGKVVGVKKGSTLVDVELERKNISKIRTGRQTYACGSEKRISMGDGIEIRGRKVTGNVITYIKEMAGNDIRVGDIKGRVDIGDKVYKVTDRRLLDEAEKSYESDFRRKISVEMSFTAKKDEYPVLKMRTKRYAVSVTGEVKAEPARNKPLDEERVRRQLEKLGATIFRPVSTVIAMDSDIAVPVSEINRMRREAADRLLIERRRAWAGRKALSDERLSGIASGEKLGDESLMEEKGANCRGLYIYRREMAEQTERIGRMVREVADGREGDVLVCIPLELYMEKKLRRRLEDAVGDSGRTVPYILEVSKGKEDTYIEDNFDNIIEAVKETGIMIGNPQWIEPFRRRGMKMYGAHGLNVYNSQSLRAFEESGVDIRAYSLEAAEYHRGIIPLMTTEHPVSAATLTDRKGAVYDVVEWYSGDKYLILGTDGENAGSGTAFMTYIE